MKISDATQSDLFIGLSILDTTPLGGVDDGIFFDKVDGATAIRFQSYKDTVQTSVAVTTVMDTSYHIYEFWVDNVALKIYAYIDGALVAPITAAYNIDEAMGFNFQFLAGVAAAKTCTLDWRRIIAIGGRDGET